MQTEPTTTADPATPEPRVVPPAVVPLPPSVFAALEAAYIHFGDVTFQWEGRMQNQRLLCQMLDAICEATGRDHQDVQDDYCTRKLAAKLAKQSKPGSSAQQELNMKTPIPVDEIDAAFGGNAMKILPPWNQIPDEFKKDSNPWVAWQRKWFFRGLKSMPQPKEGIDGEAAVQNLKCIQGSFQPKHEHKQAGVAYLASLWFESPSA